MLGRYPHKNFKMDQRNCQKIHQKFCKKEKVTKIFLTPTIDMVFTPHHEKKINPPSITQDPCPSLD